MNPLLSSLWIPLGCPSGEGGGGHTGPGLYLGRAEGHWQACHHAGGGGRQPVQVVSRRCNSRSGSVCMTPDCAWWPEISPKCGLSAVKFPPSVNSGLTWVWHCHRGPRGCSHIRINPGPLWGKSRAPSSLPSLYRISLGQSWARKRQRENWV